jgi:hypothetical protein
MRFGDQKVVLIEGHFVSYLPLCSRNEPVFLATCTPVAMPETRECVVQGSTSVFTTIHSMDMKFIHIDRKYVSTTIYDLPSLSSSFFFHKNLLVFRFIISAGELLSFRRTLLLDSLLFFDWHYKITLFSLLSNKFLNIFLQGITITITVFLVIADAKAQS